MVKKRGPLKHPEERLQWIWLLPKFEDGEYQPIWIFSTSKQHTLLAFMGSYTSSLEASYLTRHLTLYSPKSQQSVRQLRPFANDNGENAHKACNEYFSDLLRPKLCLICAGFIYFSSTCTLSLHEYVKT